MIIQKVLEPESSKDAADSLRATIANLTVALACGDPTGNIRRAIEQLNAELDAIDRRPHRGLVDYDQRIHG